jgi:CBS domain-containing protein
VVLQQDTIAFLSAIPPLDLLPATALEALIRQAGLEYFRRGAKILVQGGDAAEHLFVIKRGTVSLFLTADDGSEVVVDYRGAGEYFGLLSLISDEAPRSNVRAEEDTIGLLLPKRDLQEVLRAHPRVSDRFLKSYFLHFVDRTYDESRRRLSGLSNGHRVLFATPVGDLVRREPVATSGSASIQEAAQLMARHGISSLVVTDGTGAPVGIMTDRDLREKAVAEGRDLSQPVSAIMSSPIIHVDAGEPCSEALFKMMRHNIHHVLVTEAGRFRGMVTNHDLMVQQGSSPTLLVRKVLETVRLEHLEDARGRLETMVAVLSREGARAHNVARVITEVARKLVGRTAALVEAEVGPPSRSLAILLHGEAGRSELSLHHGPELTLVGHGGGDPDDASEGSAAGYAGSLATRLAAPPVSARCAAEGPVIDLPAWADSLRAWIAGRGPAPAAGAGLFEMTAVSGQMHLFEELRLELVAAAAASEAFRARLAAAAVEDPPPLGFLGRLVVATSGDHRNELDLYRKGIEPLADVVRILALERGIAARSTVSRLRDLRTLHDYARAAEVENAFEYLLMLRIHQQLARLEAGQVPDDFVDPQTLGNGERKSLKEAFQLISTLHDSLARRYGVEDGER